MGIIGGSGFVGNELSNHLSKKFNAKLLDVNPPGRTIDRNLKYERCDVRDYESVRTCLVDVDFVVHTAIIQIPLINEQKRLAYEVNVVGTHNVCKAVEALPTIQGMILASSWHTVGERELTGMIDEAFGFRPDKVEDRARLYALSKITQEAIVRFHDEMSEKIYGIIRMGTVLGDRMPPLTAANIFIENGLKNEPLTPYKHTMHRPMLYVDVRDICRAYESFINRSLSGEIPRTGNSLSHIVNVYYPQPVTIIELAKLVSNTISEVTGGQTKPPIEIVDKGLPLLFSENDKNMIKADVTKVHELLGIDHLLSPKDSIESIVKMRATRGL